MYNRQRVVKELQPYVPTAEIFPLFAHRTDAVFLDSSLQNKLGRYSMIGLHPYLKLEKRDGKFYKNGVLCKEQTFECFAKQYLKQHKDKNCGDLPLVSGAIGYFSYDYGRKRMGIPSENESAVDIPDAILVFYDMFLIEDGQTKQVFLVANGITGDAETIIAETEREIRERSMPEDLAAYRTGIEVTANFEKEEYKQAIERMIRYIIEGDIYIANMTQQLLIESGKAPLDVFCELRLNNPSPFGGYCNYGEFQIICASPERFLLMKNGHVETRPIKGTRKRGETPEEDQAMRMELEQSEKDKSELLMIVDLERNDLNRVCKAGSVRVTELFTVEAYATVFHLVANIEGNLKEDKTVMDLIEAAFPGGSITGAPKYRAMEIIDELEHGKRNLYTGSIGYMTLDGDCDFNIVIRTAVHRNGRYHLGVGGGITAESELEFEYEETLQKAKAILQALQ